MLDLDCDMCTSEPVSNVSKLFGGNLKNTDFLLTYLKGHLHAKLKVGSVTRFGDLLDFGQLFKAFGNN